MKLSHILLLASIASVSESNGSGNSPKQKGQQKGQQNSYLQIPNESSSFVTPPTLISQQPKTIDFMRAESPLSPEPEKKCSIAESSKNETVPTCKKTASLVTAFLAENNLLKEKTVTTKHGYTFKLTNNPEKINFDNLTESGFKSAITQWKKDILFVYNDAVANNKDFDFSRANNLLEIVINLAKKKMG